MTALSTLTRRHILLYVRDRSAVFFSMLSVLIVLLLMLVFLGDMNKDEYPKPIPPPYSFPCFLF